MIKSGLTKVGSVGGSSAPAAKTSAPAKKEEPKKEVKKEEPKVEEEEEFGGADLFGGDFWSFYLNTINFHIFLSLPYFYNLKKNSILINHLPFFKFNIQFNL